MSSLPQVSLENVAKAYTTAGDPILALTDISFSVADGEFLTIVGPSGCGKSTLLRIILGIAPPTQGRILLRGAPVVGPQPDVEIMAPKPVEEKPEETEREEEARVFARLREMGGTKTEEKPE